MADAAPLTYAESLWEVTEAFAAVQAQGLVGLHAPVGSITVSWGEWVSDTVLDVGGFGRGVDGQGWAEWLACCPPAAHPGSKPCALTSWRVGSAVPAPITSTICAPACVMKVTPIWWCMRPSPTKGGEA